MRMDDFGSAVVGPAHEVGVWRGPERRPWLRRIAHGAGFTNDWDEARLIGGTGVASDSPAAPEPQRRTAPPDAPAPDSLRMWWLPRAHDP